MSLKPIPIYLDNNATTRVDPTVLEVMRPWWDEHFGNASSGDHAFGWRSNRAVEDARAQIASLIAADPHEIVFTSGATEANNIALLGVARGHTGKRDQIIVSAIEHKCVLEAAHYLSKHGWRVDIAPVDRVGRVQVDAVADMLSEQTLLVSLMAVNNEIGTVQPIADVGAMCASAGALLHVDAAQAPSTMEIDVFDSDIALLSLSGHKIYGPKGIGALYVRSGLADLLEPLQFGGGQEGGLRSGTLPTPLCVGLGQACELVGARRDADALVHAAMRDELYASLCQVFPELIRNGDPDSGHPGNLNVTFPGIDASELVAKLQPQVAVSTGSACTTGLPHPSHVLEAIGLSRSAAESSLRFCVGRFSSKSDIDDALAKIAETLPTIARTAA